MQTNLALQEADFQTVIPLDNGPAILPFRTAAGEPTFSNTHLAQVFRRLVREETLNKVFYDGAIVNTTDCINFFHNRENEIFFVQDKDRDVGFFWLTKFRHKSAFITYCFYRDFWGRQALEISRAILDFLFSRTDQDNEHLIDVLLGLTPANNKLAVKFMLKNKMTILGKVPGILYDHQTGKRVDGIFSYRQRCNSGVRLPSLFFVL